VPRTATELKSGEQEKQLPCVWEERGEKEHPKLQKRLPPSPSQWIKDSWAVYLPISITGITDCSACFDCSHWGLWSLSFTDFSLQQ